MSSLERVFTAVSQSAASGSRSTALQPLLYLVGLLGSLFVACLYFTVGHWSCLILGVALMGTVVFLAFAYWHFAKNSPDALRSEKFNLKKLELGMKEDSMKGEPAGRLKPVPDSEED